MTLPIALNYTDTYLDNINCDKHYLYTTTVTKSLNWTRSPDGQLLREMVRKRVDYNLIDTDALDYAIMASGVIRDLIDILRDATVEAMGERNRISLTDVKSACNRLNNKFYPRLTKQEIKDISEASNDSNKLNRKEKAYYLFKSVLLKNSIESEIVHPIVLEMVEKY